MFLGNVQVDGRPAAVRIAAGVVVAVEPDLEPDSGDDVVDGRGGALLPGLHDHHLHLLATAAAASSVECGPPSVADADGLRRALARMSAKLPKDTWLRGVGYHEQVAGDLDRRRLDALLPDRPLRIQHRSGALWMLNSAALALVSPALDDSADVERDDSGAPTGRLWRYDARLRSAIPGAPPDLNAVGARLVSFGITGVTDATPDLDQGSVELLTRAVLHGGLPVRLQLLGWSDPAGLPRTVRIGPRKLLLRDHDLPRLDELVEAVSATHRQGAQVAVHCVSRESLLLTLTALEQAGSVPGDRIEHAAVVPHEVRSWIARLRVRVVTQPGFIRDRGDDYLTDVAGDDLPYLYPYASLLGAGVPVAPSSDAPYGEIDPWAAMATAGDRLTRRRRLIGADERVPAGTVLAGLLSPLDTPGGRPRTVRPGVAADLCLLGEPLTRALAEPHAGLVRMTITGGVVRYGS
ncbi:amidohydrolase family protein [Asanoa iriomotensis]|uniref:Amidohydrolase n=1 Tax=Asanoa iriomotensis TaxID=234613 RepID=A0ABQ4C3U6_9ACTN|nr:amidohydrolase [Asanoa iriomotensis]